MSVEAHLNRWWVAKWLAISLVAIGFGGLCIYDGAYAYPRDNARHAIYTEYMDVDDRAGWVEHAQAQGWSTEPPPHRSALDINSQWVMLAIAWTAGFGGLGMLLWFRGRKLAATEQELIGHRGERIPYDAITAIDKERWDKGIAWVEWEDDDGTQRRLKIDDFVFEDAWCVLEEVESQTGLGDPVPG